MSDFWFLVGVASAVMFAGSLAALPVVVMRLPEDVFTRIEAGDTAAKRLTAGRIAWRVLKNLAGIVFLIAGVLMLFLPGQGLLCVLIGLLCLEFPGKRRVILRVVGQSTVLRSMNWIRRKGGRTPLEVPAAPG